MQFVRSFNDCFESKQHQQRIHERPQRKHVYAMKYISNILHDLWNRFVTPLAIAAKWYVHCARGKICSLVASCTMFSMKMVYTLWRCRNLFGRPCDSINEYNRKHFLFFVYAGYVCCTLRDIEHSLDSRCVAKVIACRQTNSKIIATTYKCSAFHPLDRLDEIVAHSFRYKGS